MGRHELDVPAPSGCRCPPPRPGNTGSGGLFGHVFNLKFRDSLTAMDSRESGIHRLIQGILDPET